MEPEKYVDQIKEIEIWSEEKYMILNGKKHRKELFKTQNV